SEEHEQINNIIRNKIVKDKIENKTFSTFNRTFKKDFLEIYHSLPENKRYLNYGYENINHIKPKLNQLTKNYIEKNYKEEYKEFID
ncbi:relaxase MobL, partial [Planococcus sp. SIMBA_143]